MTDFNDHDRDNAGTRNASATVAGNTQDGEISLDWGLDAAVLFGRQKAKTENSVKAYQQTFHNPQGIGYRTLYPSRPDHSTRSRSVSVPNVGASIGLSYRYCDAKLSIGYRYDTFLNAMDTGIDTAKKSNVTFNGPYASISIGLGD